MSSHESGFHTIRVPPLRDRTSRTRLSFFPFGVRTFSGHPLWCVGGINFSSNQVNHETRTLGVIF